MKRRLLAIAAVIAVAAAVWQLAWLPSQAALRRSMRDYKSQQQLWSWMQTQAAAPANVQQPETGPLATLIPDTAKEQSLTVSRLDMSQDGAHVELAQASFTGLLGWLDMLERRSGATVQALTVTKAGEPGMVSATVEVKAP